jgi:hypothetical protein
MRSRIRRFRARGFHAMRSARERARRSPWPPIAGSDSGRRVAIVVVNYETRDLVSHLLFSLYRILGRDQFTQLLVVDNGSKDGSVETLTAMHEANLLHLIPNRRQRYHGPALNQAMSWLARRQAEVPSSDRVDFVWLLDSDVVVLRRSVIAEAVSVFGRTGAALVGQDDRLRQTDQDLVWLSSLMIDPGQVYLRPFPPFQDHGAPSTALQRTVAAAGLRIERFPFVNNSYVLHLGRGTLGRIARTDQRRNRFFRWAVDRPDYHYSGHPLGPHLHQVVLDLYRQEVADDTPDSLVRACQKTPLIAVPGVDRLPPVPELRDKRDRGVDLTTYLTDRFAEN